MNAAAYWKNWWAERGVQAPGLKTSSTSGRKASAARTGPPKVPVKQPCTRSRQPGVHPPAKAGSTANLRPLAPLFHDGGASTPPPEVPMSFPEWRARRIAELRAAATPPREPIPLRAQGRRFHLAGEAPLPLPPIPYEPFREIQLQLAAENA